MILVSFKDGVTVELHENNEIRIVEYGFTDDIELVNADIAGRDDIVFDIINNRLGGCL